MLIDNNLYSYTAGKFCLYSPGLDRFLWVHNDLDMIWFLSAAVSSKIAGIVIRIDTATNLQSDLDNYVCYRYTMSTWPTDYNFFAISKLMPYRPYVYKGSLVEYPDTDLTEELTEIRKFLYLGNLLKNYFNFSGEPKFLRYVNEMNPHIRSLASQEIYNIERECYRILYSEVNADKAKVLIEQLLNKEL